MTIQKSIINDNGDLYELYRVREGDYIEIYAAALNSGNHYHVIGMDTGEFRSWLEGRPWAEVIHEYMDEEDMFTDILEKESCLEGLAYLNFMRRNNSNFYTDLMAAGERIRRTDTESPALKKALEILANYMM